MTRDQIGSDQPPATTDDDRLAGLVRATAADWTLPPQRLDQTTWRDRVADDGTAPTGRSAASPRGSRAGRGRDHGRRRLRRCLAGWASACRGHRRLAQPDRRIQPERSADGVTAER